MRIAIVDYGSGNLRSVSKVVEKVAPLGTTIEVTALPENVMKADRVIFPGQGAMPDCIANLRRTGEQMLFTHSEEGDVGGLDIFKGNVVRFPSNQTDLSGARLKVPQMGWNRVSQRIPHRMWNGISDGAWFYFVHSYYVVPEDPSLIAG